MPRRYIHLFGNAACEDILEAYGLASKDQQMSSLLQNKQCPNCSEPNKPDSKFCAKCRMVLTYNAYNETLESEKEKYERDIKEIRQEMKEEMREQMAQLLTRLKPEILKQGLS
jgi:predicted amidophosphoribosyltransferase